MSRKATNGYCNPHVEVDWSVFLESDRTVDALIEFIEGERNNHELRDACSSEECMREIDRMRRLGNHASRDRARAFLSQYYSW